VESLRYPSVSDVVEVNRRVTKLTEDVHQIDEYDRERLSKLLDEVQNLGYSIRNPRQRIIAKSSFLLYCIASRQFFHEGNKRTAYTVTMTFLILNGYSMPSRDPKREKMLDLIAMGHPSITLLDLEKLMRQLVTKRENP
jgi:prophage maintenance system killer protein